MISLVTPTQVMHTEGGLDMIKHFLTNISALKPDWTMDQVLEEQMRKINELVRENLPFAVWCWPTCLAWLSDIMITESHRSALMDTPSAPSLEVLTAQSQPPWYTRSLETGCTVCLWTMDYYDTR